MRMKIGGRQEEVAKIVHCGEHYYLSDSKQRPFGKSDLKS